jgi:hypothetical protein
VAAGHYHSKTPEFAARYRQHIAAHWSETRRDDVAVEVALPETPAAKTSDPFGMRRHLAYWQVALAEESAERSPGDEPRIGGPGAIGFRQSFASGIGVAGSPRGFLVPMSPPTPGRPGSPPAGGDVKQRAGKAPPPRPPAGRGPGSELGPGRPTGLGLQDYRSR